MERNCANCDCYNDWWSPISYKAKCDLTGNIIENPNVSCDDWAPNRELELSILRKEVVCLKKENAELRQIMTDLENQPNQFCPVDKCKVVIELRSQVDELQAKLNLEKCPACDVVERYLQLKQAAQAVVDFQKCHVMHIPNHYQCEEGCIILVTHVRQGLIDNLAAILSEEMMDDKN